MKRENIAERGIWTAKKRYILNVWNSEGVQYNEPKLKMMGIEAVKSSTPAPCRQMIKDGLKLMMSGTEDDVINLSTSVEKSFAHYHQKRLLSHELLPMFVNIIHIRTFM